MVRYTPDVIRPIDSFLDHHINLRESLVDRGIGGRPSMDEVHQTKSFTTRLRRSWQSEERSAVRGIDSRFGHNDSEAASIELNKKIYFPINTYGESITKWIKYAPDTDVATYCVWNLNRNQRLRNNMVSNWREHVDRVMDQTENLVEIGLFPEESIPVMANSLGVCSFDVMDSIQSGGSGAIGMYYDHSRAVLLSNLYDNRAEMTGTSTELSRVMFHEYLHASGHKRGLSQDTDMQAQRVLRPFDEAFVEHSTTVTHANWPTHPDIINPNERPDSAAEYSTYRLERALLGNSGIDPRLLAEAYFSPRGSERGDRLRQDVSKKMGAFFGSTDRYYDFVETYEDTSCVKRDALVKRTLRSLS